MAKILLVEDEEFSRTLLSRVLTEAGHTVVLALNGVDGVAKTKSDAPDLVIMDLALPELNGWDATRQIKADPTTAKIPVLALTAAQTPEEREEAYDAGCDGYHTKPVSVPALLARIQELLGA